MTDRATRLVLATRNAHKLVELRRILAAAGAPYEVLGIADLPDPASVPEVVESGVTFEANALLKARAVAAATGLPAVADDSGLTVDVMGGMPGILSARWAGSHGDDAANLALLLDQLADLTDDVRDAAFVAAVAVVLPDGRERVVRGTLRGHLARVPAGDDGFGYDPVFVPEGGGTQTLAELSAEAKDAISHRGRALAALVPVLAEVFA